MPDRMDAPLGRLVIYTKDTAAMVNFYVRHFGYRMRQLEGDMIVELVPPGTGAVLMLHPAGQRQKMGQALVKLVFDVQDVQAFCAQAAKDGLVFSRIHKAEGYVFANAKDPSGNSVSVSSRAFAT